jgi:non-ribosomal peptide synthetase component F
MCCLSTILPFFCKLGETLFTRTVTDIMPYLSENCRFYNCYGPAECTEGATLHLVTNDDLLYRSVPLGRPMSNVHIHLLDEYLQPVIPGIHIGEIVIGGMISY